jgi:integrase
MQCDAVIWIATLSAYTGAYTAQGKDEMPKHAKKITDTSARALPVPASGYLIHWCPSAPGLGVRVTSAGARAWIAERRVDGKTVRRTLGAVVGAGAISRKAAEELQLDISSELQRGRDRLEQRRDQRAAAKADSRTLETALREYVKTKRRTKDGKALKDRTKADYLAMIEPAGKTKTGRPTLPGALHALAGKGLSKITGEDIRQLDRQLAPRGDRRRIYAMQVLRAVLRHEGVTIADSPLDKTTAGAKRISLPPTRGNPTPIPPHKLGAWWRAACGIHTAGADQLRFQLLTGCRPGELGPAGLKVKDFDLRGERVTLRDTKNRADHAVLLSRQASAIAHWHAQGQKPDAALFGIEDAGKTLALINAQAGVEGITAHKLRHTFASVAAGLVPHFTLRRMLNHISGGDVAAQHYVGVSDAELRAGWQAVADAIEAAK